MPISGEPDAILAEAKDQVARIRLAATCAARNAQAAREFSNAARERAEALCAAAEETIAANREITGFPAAA